MADRSVLVVEDDPELRTIYQEVLSDGGFEVIAARDGVDALEILDGEWTPCVLLLDLRMPRMSGWELVARLRANDRWDHLPLIIVAAYYRIAEEAERLGAHAWLQKPIDLGRLVGIVEDACGGSNGKGRHG
ncbi:MAG TPA: response regulator [Candidatus Limnocylindria bacterium]|nr:response regulator [Candidatus Limnocylindria bacterium]